MKYIELTKVDQYQPEGSKIAINPEHISYVIELGGKSSILLQGNTVICIKESYKTVLEQLQRSDTECPIKN